MLYFQYNLKKDLAKLLMSCIITKLLAKGKHMQQKIRKIGGYAFYIIISNTLYGMILFFTVTFLLQYSELYAYIANLTFIILGLLLDRFLVYKSYQPKKLAEKIKSLKKVEDRNLNDHIVRWHLTYFVSFKTSLFFFYIFILLFSQLIKFNPELVSLQMGGFINSIDYSVIILLAFKDFSEEFANDRNRMKPILDEYEHQMSKES